MERWQWQVVEAVYAVAQGAKAEAVARLHQLELLFRKTGHVAAEITATGCRGLVQASMNNPGARESLVRSVYLAQEQKQQQQQAEEEVAAAVADKCALMLSRVVGMEFEEAVGWFRLQRAPEPHEELRCQLIAAYALVDAGEVEAAVRRVQQVLPLLTAPPADESSPWPGPKLHAGLLALAGTLLHLCGHRDAALETLSQAWDVLTASGCSLDFITDNHAQHPLYILSEDEVLDFNIREGLCVLMAEYLRSGEEAAAALELDAAVNWYHKAADVARVLPSEQQGAVSHLSYRIGQALCALSKPEGIRRLEAVRDALLLEMEKDGVSGRAVALAGEEFTIHGMNLYNLQMELAEAYSKVAHDSSKAAQMYELCRDMASRLPSRLAMQLYATWEWVQAGDLLSAEEAVLEALDFLVPPEQTASASEVMSMLWGSAAAESIRCSLLVCFVLLVATLWPREQRREHIHTKLKAALEALWELRCRSLANNVDYLQKELTLKNLLVLVDVYQDDEEWAAAKGLLDALAPQLKDLRDFPRYEARQLSHTRQHLQAADVLYDHARAGGCHAPELEDASAPHMDGHADALNTMEIWRRWINCALGYSKAGQYQSAQRHLDRLESMIRAKTSSNWPPPGPATYDVDPKQDFECRLCIARFKIAMETGPSRSDLDEVVMWLHKAASLQEAIINDIQQRQLPVAKHHVRTLVSVLSHEALIYSVLNKDDVKGLEARIERMLTLDPHADKGCGLQLLLLAAKGDVEEAVVLLTELFLHMAERQEGRGGDDDSWIRDYNQGGDRFSLALLADSLEFGHIRLGHPAKALLWAERGRMRLFMHRVHAQHPEWAMDSTLNDFDRDDRKALDMLAKVLLACGPNVALLEYSYKRHPQDLLVYVLVIMSDLEPVAGSESPSIPRMGIRCITLDCTRIEQLVTDARNSITATGPQRKGEAAAATKKQLQYLAQLHSILVAEVLQDLPDSCDTLIFVPDGCLSMVPFAALYDKSAGQFLIQQKQVVVAPCLRALHRCLYLHDRFLSTASTLQQPFVAGNPCPMGLGMPQLPHAEEEAAAVADILGVKPCLGAAVTKEAVVEALCHSSVVVLASHAIVGGRKFRAGALVLQGPSSTHDPDMASSSSRASTSTAASNYDMMDPDSDEPDAAWLMRGLHASLIDKSQCHKM